MKENILNLLNDFMRLFGEPEDGKRDDIENIIAFCFYSVIDL